jgi:hypothetical protein
MSVDYTQILVRIFLCQFLNRLIDPLTSSRAALRPVRHKKARVTLASTATSFSNSNILMEDFVTRTIPTTGTTRSSAKRVRKHYIIPPLPSRSSIHPSHPSISVGRFSRSKGIKAHRRAKRDNQVSTIYMHIQNFPPLLLSSPSLSFPPLHLTTNDTFFFPI